MLKIVLIILIGPGRGCYLRDKCMYLSSYIMQNHWLIFSSFPVSWEGVHRPVHHWQQNFSGITWWVVEGRERALLTGHDLLHLNSTITLWPWNVWKMLSFTTDILILLFLQVFYIQTQRDFLEAQYNWHSLSSSKYFILNWKSYWQTNFWIKLKWLRHRKHY